MRKLTASFLLVFLFATAVSSGATQTLDAYYRDPVTTASDNVGIEAWVKSTATGTGSGRGVIAYNGFPGASGFGLLRVENATPFGGLEPVYAGMLGNTTVGFTAVENNQWTDLAMVRNGGVTTFYVNGKAAGSSTADATAASQAFSIGASYCAICDRVIPTADYFNGLVDDVRVFSFAAGQFDPAADLFAHWLPGDVNFDRRVGFDDLVVLARHYGQPGGWPDGDFNHDGNVGFDDLLILARNYGKSFSAAQLAPFSAEVEQAFTQDLGDPGAPGLRVEDSRAVPEPLPLAPLVVAAAVLLRRRHALAADPRPPRRKESQIRAARQIHCFMG